MKDRILELFNLPKFKPLSVDEIYQKLELVDSSDFVLLTTILN